MEERFVAMYREFELGRRIEHRPTQDKKNARTPEIEAYRELRARSNRQGNAVSEITRFVMKGPTKYLIRG